MTTIVERLGAATKEVHAQQERELAFMLSIDSPEAYATVLAAFLGLHDPIELRLAAIDWSGFPPSRQSRPAALRADLADLGWTSAQIEAVPLCTDLPAVDGLPAAIGVRYLVEGSALGGRIIGRLTATRLGFTPPFALRFLSSHGADPRRRFRAFAESAAAVGLTPEGEQRAIDAALETFAAFTGWLGVQAAFATTGRGG